MQKNTIKWSILIWAIFLTLIITTSFISISTQINKTLREKQYINENIQNDLEIKNYIKNEVENSLFKDKEIWNNNIIVWENKNNHTLSLKENEEKSFLTKNDNITLEILWWASIFYEDINNSNSWVINKIQTLTSSGIKIKSLWWYSQINIRSNDIIEKKMKKYEIYEKIWNKIIKKQSWEIEVF